MTHHDAPVADPEVTVVIPSVDRLDLLRLAVRSALAQRGTRVELIVVDDGSSPAINRADLDADPRIRLIRHARSRGMGAARNAGLSAARAEWVAFLDDDDAWAPDKLRLQVAAIQERNAVFGYAGAIAVTRRGQVAAEIPAPDTRHLRERLLERNVLPAGASNVVAHRDHLRELGGFDEALPHFADWDMWIRLANSGPAAAAPGSLVAYRYHSGNRSFLDDAPLRRDFDVIAARYREARVGAGVALDRVDFARFLAWGPRHNGRRLAASRAYVRAGIAERDPGSLLRAATVLLGERAMAVGAGRPAALPPLPAWATPYF